VRKPAEPPVDVATLHHATHATLLSDPALGNAARLDAIIVPTARPVRELGHVMALGRTVGCPVVVLCSHETNAAAAVTLANHLGASVLAVDVDASFESVLPAFAADRLLRRYGLGTTSDTSLKRNLGLALAHGAGWERILFLDDDIVIDQPRDLPRVAGLLDDYRAVGLANSGFADNSVVCHAFRAIGGPQDTFIGGGAMMVKTSATKSFFPNIYNEDWFFLLGDGVPFRAARAGQMRQRAFDPFANPRRAAGEELGDTLAESLFWLLDFGHSLDTAVNGFWGDALYRRRQFIDYVHARADRTPAPVRIRQSLEAARGRSAQISHRLCEDFVGEWRADLAKWQGFLQWVPVSSGADKFAWEVGMSSRLHRSAGLLAAS